MDWSSRDKMNHYMAFGPGKDELVLGEAHREIDGLDRHLGSVDMTEQPWGPGER